MTITFTDALDAQSATNSDNYSIKVWDLERTKNYGSKHLNEQSLSVTKANVNGKSIQLIIPDLEPTWGMEIQYRLKGPDGRPIIGIINNSIHNMKK